MNKALAKSITIVIALILALTAVGSAFAVYSVNATPVVVNISAALPAVDECHVLGSWNSWTAANDNKMTYSAGTYTLNDVIVPFGDATCKIYNADADTWDSDIVSCTPPHSGGNGADIVLTNAGTYNFSYAAGSGVTITGSAYKYSFKCPKAVADADAALFAWAFCGTSDGDQWLECTYVGKDSSYAYYTMPMSTDHTACCLVRFPSGTTTPNWGDKYNQSENIGLANGVIDTTGKNWNA